MKNICRKTAGILKDKRGSGEAITFMAITPVVLIIVVIVVGIIQLGMIKERLEYTVYSACRAAVVSDDLKQARQNATKAALNDLQRSGALFDTSTMVLTLKPITSVKGSKKDSGGAVWKKGNYLECEISVYVSSTIGFLAGRRSCKKIMMIERPVEYEIFGSEGS